MPAEDDAPFLDALAAVTPEAWSELGAALDAVDVLTEYATWEGGDRRDGVLQMPYPVYAPEVERLRSAIGGCGLVVPYDWMQWEGVERYRGGAGMAAAPVADAVRLVTAVMRSERFGDGSIEGALLDGTLQAALERVRAHHG